MNIVQSVWKQRSPRACRHIVSFSAFCTMRLDSRQHPLRRDRYTLLRRIRNDPLSVMVAYVKVVPTDSRDWIMCLRVVSQVSFIFENFTARSLGTLPNWNWSAIEGKESKMMMLPKSINEMCCKLLTIFSDLDETSSHCPRLLHRLYVYMACLKLYILCICYSWIYFEGIGMDSCITPIRHGGLSLVQTSSIMYPIIDDPYMLVSWPIFLWFRLVFKQVFDYSIPESRCFFVFELYWKKWVDI